MNPFVLRDERAGTGVSEYDVHIFSNYYSTNTIGMQCS